MQSTPLYTYKYQEKGVRGTPPFRSIKKEGVQSTPSLNIKKGGAPPSINIYRYRVKRGAEHPPFYKYKYQERGGAEHPLYKYQKRGGAEHPPL